MMTTAPSDCAWASGKVSSAALFVEKGLSLATPGTVMVAILPEVLRSGSRYDRWRNSVEEQAQIKGILPWGRFDPQTDVDVFILRLVVGVSGENAEWIPSSSPARLSRIAEVSVGPVVEYRHKECGPARLYASPRTIPAWSEIRDLHKRRRFDGKVYDSPFVLVENVSAGYGESRCDELSIVLSLSQLRITS